MLTTNNFCLKFQTQDQAIQAPNLMWISPICVQKNKENPALCTAVIAVYFLAQVRSSWDLICSVTTELQRFENSTKPWANSSTNNYKRKVQIFKEKEEGNQLSASLKKKKGKKKDADDLSLTSLFRKKTQALRAYEPKCEREQKLKFSAFKGTLYLLQQGWAMWTFTEPPKGSLSQSLSCRVNNWDV